MTKAIVLAAYGSRHANAVASLEHILERVREAHPGLPVRLAYTSKVIRGHLAQTGEQADSVAQALDGLAAEGVTRAVIQSLHIIPGKEFHELLELARERVPDQFERLEVGLPLVAGEEGVERVARAIHDLVPAHQGTEEAVLFMGHGTMHPGDAYYEALHRAIQRIDPAIHIGTMDTEPGIEAIIHGLTAEGVKRVHLMPFLFGAGWHAAKDMVGGHEESWKSLLEKAGVACAAVLKGAGEYDQLVDIWLAHLNGAMDRLDRS